MAYATDAQAKALNGLNTRTTSEQRGLTLGRLKNGFPVSLQKDLVQAVKPALSDTENLSLAQDLTAYWERVERAVGRLEDEICMDRLERWYILQIGAIIWGDSV